MVDTLLKTQWLDIAEEHPWLRELSSDEMRNASRWLFWKIYNSDPEKARGLLQQLLLDWGYFGDHETWHSPA